MEQGHGERLADLATGVELIDGQHRQFLEHLAELRNAIIGGAGVRDRLMKTLRYLDEFIVVHFSAEEKFMRLHNYPGILVHEREHERFSQTYRELKRRALDLEARGEITSFLAIEVEHTLERWLEEHMLTQDRKMAAFLIRRL